RTVGLASPSSRPRASHVKDFSYKVPGTNTSLELIVNFDEPLPREAARDLLARSITEVNFILEIAGDGLVPEQEYGKEIRWKGTKVRINVFGRNLTRELLTYNMLKDTLNGLRDEMVTNSLTFKTYAIMVHGSLGVVGHARIFQPGKLGQIADV
ncbi:MAG: hypothetical protein Q9196_007152, partial [Gyalolechia fulgens]